MTETKKILLAEDDQFIARAGKAGLTRAGFEVDTARDGEEALQKISENPPDLLLLDLVMPNKDGFEVLEELNKSGDIKKFPVIVFSNLGQDSDVERSKSLGAAYYLVKSNTSMKTVVQKVQEQFKKA